jgi:hypothetical protein
LPARGCTPHAGSVSERLDFLARPVLWRRTDSRVFVRAARLDRAWWVLRINGFPDHPPYTLFSGGVVVGDVWDVGITAPAWELDATGRPPLTDAERREVLALMRGLGPYGSEFGLPCTGDWCPCLRFTDDYAGASTERNT